MILDIAGEPGMGRRVLLIGKAGFVVVGKHSIVFIHGNGLWLEAYGFIIDIISMFWHGWWREGGRDCQFVIIVVQLLVFL